MVYKGKWTALPEAALRLFLTCPLCRHEYLLTHTFCGICLDVREALGDGAKCPTCFGNGQDPTVAPGIADCPKCGLECRSLDQVEDEPQDKVSRSRSRTTRKPIPKRDRPTEFLGSTQLRATVLASDVATPGMAGVTVVNPLPGGGRSNVEIFTICR